MKSALVLLPSFFFLSAFVLVGNLHSGSIARLEAEANGISLQMNALSTNMSHAMQMMASNAEMNVSQDDYLEKANQRMDSLRRRLETTWSVMDREKIAKARCEALAILLRQVGIVSAAGGFLFIWHARREMGPYCLISLALLIAIGAVAI